MQSAVLVSHAIFCISILYCTEVDNSTVSTTNDSDVKVLNIMGFFPYSGVWQGGPSMHAASMMALDDVNRMQTVPGYRLKIHVQDTKCDRGHAVKKLFDELFHPPIKLLILGAGCSPVSESTASISHLFNLVQVSYISVSPALSNKDKFPLFARLSASDLAINPFRVKMLKHFDWREVCIVYTSLDLFIKTADDLFRRLTEEKFSVLLSLLLAADPFLQVLSLKQNDCQIIVGLFYADTAREVMCDAYKLGLYGPQIVWILNGWYTEGWWKVPSENVQCSPEELEETLEGYFEFGMVYLNRNPTPSVSGLLPAEFVEKLSAAIRNRPNHGAHIAAQAYDSVWAIALALNITRQRLLDMGSSVGLEDFTYEDKNMSKLIYSSLLNLTFMGLRGPVGFDEFGDSLGYTQARRFQGGVMGMICLYNSLSDGPKLLWNKDNPIIWKDGVPPRGWTLTRKETVRLTLRLYIVMCVLAGLGILLAISFLAFNIKFRTVRVVKMSSPRLNNVILLGCIMTYATVFVQNIGAGHGRLGCEMKTVLLVVGISLVFGSLFAKTWRVHSIFTNTYLQKKGLSDGRLMCIVGVLVLIDFVIFITWWKVDPRAVKVIAVDNVTSKDLAGKIKIERITYHCISHHEIYFTGTLFGLHALLLLFGTFLAYETRNVHYPELNDSKQIAMCIYNVTILAIPAIVLSFTLKSDVDFQYGISSSLTVLGTTLTQCFIFVPKVTAYHNSKIGIHDSAGSSIRPARSSQFPSTTSLRQMAIPEENVTPDARYKTSNNSLFANSSSQKHLTI